jgi:ribosome-binding protein aMBF1 (putative translation factor)
MTLLASPIADTLVESLESGKSTATAQNPSDQSDICVGGRLRIKRTSRGISRQELSERLGIDRADLNAYEAGTERICANLLLRIAKVLDVRPDYFFLGYTEDELEGCLTGC